MAYQPSEQVKRVQKIVEILEKKRQEEVILRGKYKSEELAIQGRVKDVDRDLAIKFRALEKLEDDYVNVIARQRMEAETAAKATKEALEINLSRLDLSLQDLVMSIGQTRDQLIVELQKMDVIVPLDVSGA